MDGRGVACFDGRMVACFFVKFVPEKGGQFYTMGESVVVMAEEHCVSPVQGVTFV